MYFPYVYFPSIMRDKIRQSNPFSNGITQIKKMQRSVRTSSCKTTQSRDFLSLTCRIRLPDKQTDKHALSIAHYTNLP